MTPGAAVTALAAGLCDLVVALHAGRALTARPRGAPPPGTPRRAGPVRLPWRIRRRERVLDAAFPELLDLLVVSVQGGMLPAQALVEAAPLVPPPLGEALDALGARLARGERFADALHVLVARLGPRALGLVATVVAAERHGLPLAPAVERLADEARGQRRRLAEAAARELPVRLSFPLVLCTLPSFALVAIVPLLVAALSSLRVG